jgi:predicted short-subunit dehydrogenase-like oxidoreductase (DUF2520 family)
VACGYAHPSGIVSRQSSSISAAAAAVTTPPTIVVAVSGKRQRRLLKASARGARPKRWRLHAPASTQMRPS